MNRLGRVIASLSLGAAAALGMPLYPLRSELRSWVVGGAGDEISYQWSFHTLVGLFEHLRYERDSTLLAVGNVVLFVVLAAALAFTFFAASKRMGWPR